MPFVTTSTARNPVAIRLHKRGAPGRKPDAPRLRSPGHKFMAMQSPDKCRGSSFSSPQNVNDFLEKVWDLNDIDEVFESLSPTLSSTSHSRKGRKMYIDISETKEAYAIMADVPGLKKGDVKVRVDGNTLTISVPGTPAATAATAAVPGSEAVPGSDADAGSEAVPRSEAVPGSEAVPDSEAAPQATPKATAEEPVFHRRERGKFAARTVTLPESADMAVVGAQMTAGTLTVTVAKHKEAVNAKRDVPVA